MHLLWQINSWWRCSHQKTRGIYLIVCGSLLSDIYGLNYDFWYFYWSMTIMIQIFYFIKILKDLNVVALILWTTKDQAFILIPSHQVNRLFDVVGNSYPITKSPQNINSITSTLFNLRDWTEIQGRINQSKHHYFPTSLQSQKPSELP
jgi:hypothetical protein